MFDQLTGRLQRVFKTLRGEGKLSEAHVSAAMREIRLALLEADVNFRVVKQLVEAIRSRAAGREVLQSLTPTQQVIKIVRDELVELLGGESSPLSFAAKPPSVYLLAGLQGSGKTTTAGKLARWLARNGHRPLLLSIDVYRPAAREQLSVIARDLDLPCYRGEAIEDPLQLCRSALLEAGNSGCDVLLIDTAGRLHIDDALMQELQQVRDLVAENQVSDAMTLCRRYPSVMGRILLVTIANHDRDREELRSIVEDAGSQEVSSLDRNLGALGTIAAISPLIGLTGTVFGMIRTFAIISEKGIAHPSQLAGGIYEALITTATGLVIAIPTLIFYNYFTNKADRLILEIEKHSYRVVETLKR